MLGTASRWSIPFVASEPLPLVSAVVNGSAQGSFLVDTGAGDVLLDEAFARQAGVELGGRETGQFAGGRHGSVRHGRAETLQLDGLELADLPLEVLDLSARGASSRQISEGLFISEKTVARPLNNMFTRLGLANRAAATAYAYEHELV